MLISDLKSPPFIFSHVPKHVSILIFYFFNSRDVLNHVLRNRKVLRSQRLNVLTFYFVFGINTP